MSELKITDVNNWYVARGRMRTVRMNGFWSDAGTFDSLLRASELIAKKKVSKKS